MSCFDEGNCTATELGEMYMQAYQWGASQGGYEGYNSSNSWGGVNELGYEPGGAYSQFSDFWADAMGQYSDDYNQSHPYGNLFMSTILPEYGNYVYGMMPGEGIFQDYQDLQRAERMGSMKTQGLRDTFSRDLSSQRFAVGSTGLTGIGSGILNQQDLYSQFQLDAQAEAMQVEQAQNEIYGDLGEEISGDLDYLFDPTEGGGGVDPDEWYDVHTSEFLQDEYEAGNLFMSSDGEFGSTMVPLDPGLEEAFAHYMSNLTTYVADGSTGWTGVSWGTWVDTDEESVSNFYKIQVSNEACAQFMFDQGYGNNVMDAMQYCTAYSSE